MASRIILKHPLQGNDVVIDFTTAPASTRVGSVIGSINGFAMIERILIG